MRWLNKNVDYVAILNTTFQLLNSIRFDKT